MTNPNLKNLQMLFIMLSGIDILLTNFFREKRALIKIFKNTIKMADLRFHLF